MITLDLFVDQLAGTRPALTRRMAGLCRMGAVLTCTAFTVHGFWLRTVRASLDAQSIAKEAQLSNAADDANRLDSLRQRHAAVVVEAAAVSRLVKSRTQTTELFEAIGRSLADGVWLIEVHRSDVEVRVEGRAVLLARVASFARNLEANYAFVAPLEIRSVLADGEAFRFQITGRLATEGEAQP